MPPKLDNVQKLLAAEEKRNGLIADAKQRKQQKVRLAKTDAEAEVAVFRREKEKEYEAYRQQQTAKAEAEHAVTAQETDSQLVALRTLTASRMNQVADLMKQHILSVQQ
eukprot:gene6518-4695_t